MSGDDERRQRAAMATDAEWERICRAAPSARLAVSPSVPSWGAIAHSVENSPHRVPEAWKQWWNLVRVSVMATLPWRHRVVCNGLS